MGIEYKIKQGDKIHFVGIGGIGMSGLAQLFAAHGCEVSGSDRGAAQSENQAIISPLLAQNIKIFPQDGSFIKSITPDCLVYSTAIEDDNPDFLAAPEIPRVHRAGALAAAVALNRKQVSIAVAGSCGKTTVTAWLAEALYNLGADPACLDGGLVNTFRAPACAGNYRNGKGRYFVFEADESDKSLLVYRPDYVLILNMGTDHYPKEELAEVFASFATGAGKGVILEREVYSLIKDRLPEKLRVIVFGPEVHSYEISDGRAKAKIGDGEIILPVPGRHNAFNAAAVLATLAELGYDCEAARAAAENFNGVRRRFDHAGHTAAGAAVYDDYAHNPEKIASCIHAAQEIAAGKVFAVFQPHGFGPFGFMRETLFEALEKTLRPEDRFIFLPPFYAGGTSSFKPSSEEVTVSYRQNGTKKYFCYPSRAELTKHLDAEAGKGDMILIMGARDNSLADYARSLAK
ncbi:MAG: Mur ligase domain-containing protein [Victivallaceae bacterium]|nr:Mur ligase domain-containing protein [Victivallaceae bacterium]